MLVGPALVVLTACGGGGTLASSGSGGYYHVIEEQPHPGIAEGKPVVEVDGHTFYACPALAVGETTPLIEDACLTPGDAGASRYGDYSMLEASKTCADGRRLTDAGGLGLGFVGSPLIGQTQSAPDRAAAFDCLAGLDGSAPAGS
ncbi:MAG: hypothetical protein JWO60_1783 [Frankiales bacterium]|nr:hypothetical protein [Frankiales bacterium]